MLLTENRRAAHATRPRKSAKSDFGASELDRIMTVDSRFLHESARLGSYKNFLCVMFCLLVQINSQRGFKYAARRNMISLAG